MNLIPAYTLEAKHEKKYKEKLSVRQTFFKSLTSFSSERVVLFVDRGFSKG